MGSASNTKLIDTASKDPCLVSRQTQNAMSDMLAKSITNDILIKQMEMKIVKLLCHIDMGHYRKRERLPILRLMRASFNDCSSEIGDCNTTEMS